jgi:hypothetical protein
MECMVEVRWDDPIAAALSHMLLSGREGVEQATSYVPHGQNRAFVVYRYDTPDRLHDLVAAVSQLGARVCVTPLAANLMPVAA